MTKKNKGPRVLFLDIETAPILAYVWGLWEQNVGLNMIKEDWHILSWAAKWMDEDEIHYDDQRDAKDVEDDKKLLKSLWKLLDEADIIITHNGKHFDQKKIYARLVINEIEKPSSFKHIDTLEIAKRHFGFTSNKLEHLAETLKVKYKKEKHKKYPGFELWEACLLGDQDAWKEMERYNKQDVLALEAVYEKLIPWSNNAPNFAVYYEGEEHVCLCGSTQFKKNGFDYTNVGKFQRYKCKSCKKEYKDGKNLFSKEKRASIKRNVT